MTPVEIIAIATRLSLLATGAIEAANNGDLEKAKEYLKDAREVYEQGIKDWDEAFKDV